MWWLLACSHVQPVSDDARFRVNKEKLSYKYIINSVILSVFNIFRHMLVDLFIMILQKILPRYVYLIIHQDPIDVIRC